MFDLINPFAEVEAVQDLDFMWGSSSRFLPSTVLVYTCCRGIMTFKASSPKSVPVQTVNYIIS